MAHLTRRGLLFTLPPLLLSIRAGAEAAETYPSRPVIVVVPYAAGGGLDLVARLLAQQLTERTKQSFFVENRLGAGGVIAAASVAKAAPDGYTIFAGSSTQLAIQVTLHKALSYDPAADFVPLALVASVPFVLIVNPLLPVHTAGDLIDLAKKRPGQLSFGSSGVGGPPHLYMELLQTMTAGFDAVAWIMLVAPAATPPAIVDTLHAELKSIVAAPQTQEKLIAFGVIPIDTPPVQELKAMVKSEIARWGKVVEHAGLAGSQ